LKLSFIAIFCILNTTVYSQRIKDCTQLSALINFGQILKNFRLSERLDSLVLIDKNGVISNNCSFIKWGKCILRLTHDRAIANRAVKGGSSEYFKNECQYFVIDNFKQKGYSYTFTIFRACSNEFIECKVWKNKGKYSLIWFSGGDY
jgi:hypothetical protein